MREDSVSCTRCDGLYHQSCVNFVPNTPLLDWKCSDCVAGFDLLFMNEALTQLKKDVTGLKTLHEDSALKVNAIMSQLDVVSSLSNQVNRNKTDLMKANKSIYSLNHEVNELDIASRRNNLVVVGLPESLSMDLKTLVIGVAKNLQVSIQLDDIPVLLPFQIFSAFIGEVHKH